MTTVKILHFMNKGSHPFHYVQMLRRKGIDAELLFPEEFIHSHPLWEIFDTDIEEVCESEEERRTFFPRTWLRKHREELPEWVHPIEYHEEGKPALNWTSPTFFWKIVRELRDFDCDLIHAWSLHGAVWASFSGKPFIYHTTGWFDWWGWRRVENPVKRWISGFLAKRALKKASHIVCNAPDVMKEMKSSVNSDSLTIMKHPIDNEFFKPRKLDLEIKNNFNAEFLLFAPARHHWESKKNNFIFEALNSLEDLSKSHLITIEWGPDLEKSKKLVRELDLGDKVSFLPLMSRPKFIRYLNSVDCVLDAFRRGFGTIATQTLACGTPLISALKGAEKRLLMWGVDSLPPILQAESSDEIMEHLSTIKDPKKAQRIGKESRKWIEENYHWEDLIEDYINLYEKILNTT